MTKKLEFFRVFVLQKMVLFASFLHFFSTGLAKRQIHCAPFSQNRLEKKPQKHHSRVLWSLRVNVFFEKRGFRADFLNTFSRTPPETKYKCCFQGDRPPSLLLILSFFQLFGTCELRCFIFRDQSTLVSVG